MYTFDELYGRLPEDIRKRLDTSEQDPHWHPEGVVVIHARMVFDYAAKHFPGDLDLLVCAIFHDMGKPDTQQKFYRDGKVYKISNKGHENLAEKYIEKYFHLYSDITTNKEKVIAVCKNHMRAHLYTDKRMSNPNKRKTFESHPYFKDIMNFSSCDENYLKV